MPAPEHDRQAATVAASPVNHLGEFLRSRRAAVTPDAAGLTTWGSRRVPGLRREELAQLAGVSINYYTRLEQGQSANASDAVIDAIASALQLDEAERAHLRALARPAPRRAPRLPRAETPSPGALRLLAAMSDVPAMLLGRRADILGWNTLGHALLASHLDPVAPQFAATRPNQLRLLFLDPHTRELYRDWAEEAAMAVASLRFQATHQQDERRLAELIGELSLRSPEFAQLWTKQDVRLCSSGTRRLHHPVVGDLELHFEALHLPDSAGQRLLTHTAEPGSSSAAALALLS